MKTVPRTRRLLVLLAFLAAGNIAEAVDPTVEGDFVVSFAMFDDPRIDFPPELEILPPGHVELWVKTLGNPDAELQRQAALAIERAHRLQYADLSPAVPSLRALSQDPQSSLSVRVSAATALLTLDDQNSAQTIMELAQSAGPSAAQIVEPVLARWRYQPAISMWLARLSDPSARRSELRLAVECLATVNELQAGEGLQNCALDPARESTLRLAAARSWATIQRSGLEDIAQRLLSAGSPQKILERLIGASLLRHHDSSQTREILVEVAVDSEPAVAAVAWERLLEIDSSLALPIAEPSLMNPDARIRGYAARTLYEHATIERLITLAGVLNDPHPDLRNDVRRALLRHAQNPQFDKTIREEAVNVLLGDDWRGLEQAGMLLAALDHEQIAPRLFELLEHPRREVALMAAWGLRVLAVPETLPTMLAYTQQGMDPNFRGRQEYLHQCAHLFEAFGLMRYSEAEPLLRKFVSRNSPPPKEDYSRSAAIWALGFLNEGEPDQRLARQLVARLNDIDSDPPESDLVRRFAAITLGRMQAKSALPDLRTYSSGQFGAQGAVDYACGWAIERLTGEPVPDPAQYVRTVVNWFLEPLDK